MTYKELKKILRAAGIGGMFGGIRLFDGEYDYPTADDMRGRVRKGMETLEGFGYVPSRDYSEYGADCENSAKWLQAIVTFKWYLDNRGEKSFPAYPFGTAILPGHAINIGVTQSGLLFFNYGELTTTPETIKEVEFY